MRTINEALVGLKPGNVLDLGGETVLGGVTTDPPPHTTVTNLILQSGWLIYRPVDTLISHVSRDGLRDDGSFTLEDTSLGIVDGDHWTIDQCSFANTTGYTQVSVGGDCAKNWAITNCTFGAHTQQGLLPPGETNQQEHSLYIHNNKGTMGGLLQNLEFQGPNYGGATLKLGGVDDVNGMCRGVVGKSIRFTGTHDLEVLVVSGTVDLDVYSNSSVATRQYPWSLSVHGNNNKVTMHGAMDPKSWSTIQPAKGFWDYVFGRTPASISKPTGQSIGGSITWMK